jgi:hypothetical protein
MRPGKASWSSGVRSSERPLLQAFQSIDIAASLLIVAPGLAVVTRL